MDQATVTNDRFAAFVRATGYVTVAERTPTAAEFPGAPPENLVAGSVVFSPPPHLVPPAAASRRGAVVKGDEGYAAVGRRGAVVRAKKVTRWLVDGASLWGTAMNATKPGGSSPEWARPSRLARCSRGRPELRLR